jgi:hypothetical protein
MSQKHKIIEDEHSNVLPKRMKSEDEHGCGRTKIELLEKIEVKQSTVNVDNKLVVVQETVAAHYDSIKQVLFICYLHNHYKHNRFRLTWQHAVKVR